MTTGTMPCPEAGSPVRFPHRLEIQLTYIKGFKATLVFKQEGLWITPISVASVVGIPSFWEFGEPLECVCQASLFWVCLIQFCPESRVGTIHPSHWVVVLRKQSPNGGNWVQTTSVFLSFLSSLLLLLRGRDIYLQNREEAHRKCPGKT